jgi:glycosyltransferase involved in cell wall biosynthesis
VKRTVYVCPLRIGTGIKVKLLEAMACGMPAVVTPISIEGMPVEDGRHVLVARTPAEFAQRTRQLLGSPALRRELGREAQQLVRSRYDWRAIGEQVERIYREVTA